MNKPQIIKADGKPAFAVIPIDEYRRLQDCAEMLDDIRAFDAATANAVESFPAEVADRLIEGENPVRVFRQYRGITAADLAKSVGVKPATISMIETGKRRGSVERLQAIAQALRVSLNDLVD